MRPAALLLLAFVEASSCTRAGFSTSGIDAVSVADSSAVGDSAESADSRTDVEPADAASPKDIRTDLPPPDGPLHRCQQPVDGDTLLRLSFESIAGQTIPDVAGSHPASLAGSGAKLVAGQAACGKALLVPSAMYSGAHVLVPDSPDWDLKQGSIELQVRFDEPVSTLTTQGLVVRDSEGIADGHLALLRACDGAIVVRLQAGGADHGQCSNPVPDKVWIHVGVNFGPGTGLQLYVDGVLQSRTGSVTASAHLSKTCSTVIPCGKSTPHGIDGNKNPWIIGAVSFKSTSGTADAISHHLGGAIDELRISSVPRSFGP